MSKLIEFLVNLIMKLERDVFCKNNCEGNKANGYYDRSLNSGSMKLNLKVPRDRNGDFRPYILPDRWKRSDDRYRSLLLSLISAGYSKSNIKRVLKELGLQYSDEIMQKIRSSLEESLKEFRTRELKSQLPGVFIDAHQCDVKKDYKKSSTIHYYWC